MKTENLYVYFFFISVIIICLIFGNTKNYENATTLSKQKTEYIQELNEDLGDVKVVEDRVTDTLNKTKYRNEEIKKNVDDEQKQLEILKKRKNDEIEEYKKLNNKWKNGLYLNPVIELKFSNDGKSIINTSNSPDNNIPTDNMKSFNVDVNNNNTTITNFNGWMIFNNDISNYVSFPIIYLDKFTIMFSLITLDEVYHTVVSLTNKKTMDPGIQIDVQGLEIKVFNALPSNRPWGVILSYRRSSTVSHVTYVYNYDASSKNTIVKLFINGKLVVIDTGKGPLLANKPSYERPDTCMIGRSGDTGDKNRAFYGGVSNFKFFALDLPDDMIVKNMKD